ncbi:transcription antitermination factor NusB [Paraburkholderia xenovorans]|uniref:transcription antitermination factor NusB n=1 Tax=Paraburkholderia xenovorans TaxID=36873 RepID=UPI001559B0AA|nr:transcription antitermination factor NusB [Paraburkholderia xenovorans]NPT37878.1 transcription antitermination factor NusB [Paraburkholderia xenovorans]
MKSARRRSRELATQGLYQWLLSGSPGGEIDAQLRGAQGFDKADHEHLDAVLHGVIRDSEALSAAIAPCLDRPIEQLSPVERAVLLVAAFELKNHLDIPYRVVINEAVELAKTFGGADGYKYVNGVLDKLSAQLRADETQAARKR